MTAPISTHYPWFKDQDSWPNVALPIPGIDAPTTAELGKAINEPPQVNTSASVDEGFRNSFIKGYLKSANPEVQACFQTFRSATQNVENPDNISIPALQPVRSWMVHGFSAMRAFSLLSALYFAIPGVYNVFMHSHNESIYNLIGNIASVGIYFGAKWGANRTSAITSAAKEANLQSINNYNQQKTASEAAYESATAALYECLKQHVEQKQLPAGDASDVVDMETPVAEPVAVGAKRFSILNPTLPILGQHDFDAKVAAMRKNVTVYSDPTATVDWTLVGKIVGTTALVGLTIGAAIATGGNSSVLAPALLGI